MVTELKTRFKDYLPAVLRQDEVDGVNFLGRFLQAFEEVFESLQQEIDNIPDLFSLAPTPTLESKSSARTSTLRLDSAAGLCPGDVLQIVASASYRVEFVTVKSVSSKLIPAIVKLNAKLRHGHSRGTPLQLVGQPGPSTTLSLPAMPGENTLVVAEAEALGIESGDVLQVDGDGPTEYVRVVSVKDASITITPKLKHIHEIKHAVVLMRPVSLTTPPLVFGHAARSGPEMTLRAATLAGVRVLELDTVAGLRKGDVLCVREPELSRAEAARVQKLPPAEHAPRVTRFGVRLDRPLRFSHTAGLTVDLLKASDGATRLAAPAKVKAETLHIEDLNALKATFGDWLQVGQAATADFVQMLAGSAQGFEVAPPLRHNHGAQTPVVLLRATASGVNYLSWLAGWVGLNVRSNRGERWHRELLRLAGRIWPWRGTKAGTEAFLNAYLKGEAQARILDLANPLQIGLVSTIGEDTSICGGLPFNFWVELLADERNTRLYHPEGLVELVRTAHSVLQRKKPAHTYYDLFLQAHTMQIGLDSEMDVGARVGDTTLLWDEPVIFPGRQ